MNKFQLDIITPIGIQSYNDVSYIRVPGLDGLLGIQAKHASAIIALTIGEIKITNNNKSVSFATSGGFVDIRPEGIQLLIETIELSKIFTGEHIHSQYVEYHQVQKISLQPTINEVLNIDGELKGMTPLSIEVDSKKLFIYN